MHAERFLDGVLGQRSKVAVLRLLAREPELTGREIARRAGLSPRAAQQALQSLHASGVLNRKTVGAAFLFSLNAGRYVVRSMLRPLFERERGLMAEMLARLGRALPREGVISVVLFGSAARGEGRRGSDVDVMICVKDSMDVDRLAEAVRDRSRAFSGEFGMPVSPYVIRRRDLVSRFDKKDKLIRNIVREGCVLRGKPLGEVLALEPEKDPR
ncbi:MAG: nucleotidyltransferase domain-containing protein [Elusimicrobia bacterium]|nr:nucleotidyltransferase domain-containing protein [Elusimicrobiota bacterium]